MSKSDFLKAYIVGDRRVGRIRNVICVILDSEDVALSGREVYSRLLDVGYGGSLESCCKALNRMRVEGVLLSVNLGERFFLKK